MITVEQKKKRKKKKKKIDENPRCNYSTDNKKCNSISFFFFFKISFANRFPILIYLILWILLIFVGRILVHTNTLHITFIRFAWFTHSRSKYYTKLNQIILTNLQWNYIFAAESLIWIEKCPIINIILQCIRTVTSDLSIGDTCIPSGIIEFRVGFQTDRTNLSHHQTTAGLGSRYAC